MSGARTPQELAEALYAALTKGDTQALADVVAPHFVGTVTDGLPLGMGGRHDGRDAMRDRVWWTIGRHFRAEAQPESFHLLDDGRLLVEGTYRGHGRRSGLPLEARFVHVITTDGDQVVALDQLTDSAAWVQALGDAAPLKTIDYSVRGGVASVRLDRPEVRNAIDLHLAQELLVVARRIEADPAVRAVLISGAGASLTVGGDISYFADHADEDFGNLLRTMTTPFHEAFRILNRLDVPIVTAAHGPVAGGGLGFVYAADVCLVAEGTTFTTAFAALGLSGDGGGTYHLPRRIGPARAARVMLENRPITADQALRWGLVAEVVPADRLLDEAQALAARLAAGPTLAYAHMRGLLHDTWGHDLSQQLAAETEHLVATARTDDARNAVGSFLAKQQPTFEGH